MGVFILKQFLVCMRTYQEGQVPTLPAISCGYHLAWKVLRVTLRAGSGVQCLLWVLTPQGFTHTVDQCQPGLSWL